MQLCFCITFLLSEVQVLLMEVIVQLILFEKPLFELVGCLVDGSLKFWDDRVFLLDDVLLFFEHFLVLLKLATE